MFSTTMLILAATAQSAINSRLSLFEWIRQGGGFVHENLEISTGPDPTWTERGLFATKMIDEGQRLLSLPRRLALCHEHPCQLIQMLQDELASKNSFYEPYLNSVKDSIPDLVGDWTPAEQEWLNGVFPENWDKHTVWYEENCDGDLSVPEEKKTLDIFVSRVSSVHDEYCLVPLYDLMNHKNGRGRNAGPDPKTDPHSELWFEAHAVDDIKSGGQVFTSFGNLTADIFRDFGFLEEKPQVWEWEGEDDELHYIDILDDGKVLMDPDALGQARIYLKQLKATTPPNEAAAAGSTKRFQIAMKFRNEWIKALQLGITRGEQTLQQRKDRGL